LPTELPGSDRSSVLYTTRLDDLLAPLERLGERDLVGVLEIAADGEAARDARQADAERLQELRQVDGGRLALDVGIRRGNDLLHDAEQARVARGVGADATGVSIRHVEAAATVGDVRLHA